MRSRICAKPASRRRYMWVLSALVAGLGVVAPSAVTAEDTVVAGEYIIQRSPAHPTSAAAAAQRDKVVTRSYSIQSTSKSFEVVAVGAQLRAKDLSRRVSRHNPSVVERDCAEILKDPTVRTCEPNVVRTLFAVPNDTFFSSQWALDNNVNSDVNAPEAWNSGTGTNSTLIGVIDSGIYGQHPDLAANLWSNPNEVSDGFDNDGNGYVDDIFGVNTFFGNGNPSDCNGHGTHVSGIIGAAGNNGAGVTGVNWTTSLIVASISSDCSGSASLSSVIRAYDYFTDLKNRGHQIRVVNASFGGTSFSSAERNAIDRLRAADILLVAAAGNSNVSSDETPSYPANYELPNIISVGATGPTRQRAAYSNYGQSVDIAAPGGDSDYSFGAMYSTWSPLAPGGVLYRYSEGTSMAAPMVTGGLGLLASLQPAVSGAGLKKMLLDSASVVPELTSAVAGGRFLNLATLVASVPPSDSCPDDPSKLEPGACGCGIPDTDVNSNGRWDCLESSVAELLPPRPWVRLIGRRVLVAMQPLAGVDYYLEVVVLPPRFVRTRPRTAFFLSATQAGSLAKPPRGTTLKVRYAYRARGTTSDFSYWSPYTTLRIRK